MAPIKNEIIILVTAWFLYNFSIANGLQETCESKISCGDCIKIPSCAWCMQPDYDDNTKSRCFNYINTTTDNNCLEEFIWNPLNQQRITLNRAFLSNTEEIVHISPQRVNLKLRMNEKYRIQLRHSVFQESSVEIKDNATSAVQVQYYSSCLNEGIATETNKCSGLKTDDVVTFIAEIEVLHCSEDPKDWLQNFHIYLVGVNESLVVDLEISCDCPCERKDYPTYEKNSPKCNSMGTYKCGICDCNANAFGKRCECNGGDNLDHININNRCRPSNATLLECSGRGTCICGACECIRSPNPEEIVSGSFCECDNFSCVRHNGLICSGHGSCECGICRCQPGWKGYACNIK